MKVSQNLNLQQVQKLVMTPEMRQSLEIIQLPVMDLREEIKKQVLDNPFLEMKDEFSTRLDRKKKEPKKEIDQYYTGSKYSVRTSTRASYDEGGAQAYIEEGVSERQGLHEWLEWQLNLLELDKDVLVKAYEVWKDVIPHDLDTAEKRDQWIEKSVKDIGRSIISFIDHDGFFKENIDSIFSECSVIAYEMLDSIQSFDPPGVASADVRSALLFQLESLPEDHVNGVAYEILRDYFDLLLERKDAQIAKKLKVTPEEIKEAFTFISQFQPYPGRSFDSSGNEYVIPDAFVYLQDDDVIVEINDEIIPSLTVSRTLQKIAEESKGAHHDANVKYADEKIKEAQSFINIIDHRHSSIKKLVMAISRHQEAFFRKGPKYLVPLTMKTIADEINLAESTVSRLSASKYIHTQWGIHAVKYFFTNSINKENDESPSAESTREIIREIIDEYGSEKLSDQKIADILKNRGISIARRTVAKYRNKLNILPSGKRNI